jgi:hypothetical protein
MEESGESKVVKDASPDSRGLTLRTGRYAR